MDQKEAILLPDAAEKLGVKTHVLRYLCNKGLIPGVRRDRRGYRVLDQAQLELAKVLIDMKRAGFAANDLRRYSRLCRQGDATQTERTAILTTRKRQIWREITELQHAIDFIERQEELLHQPDAASED